MKENDLNEAKNILKTKRDNRHIRSKLDKVVGARIYIIVGELKLEVRESALKELLDKEIAHNDKVLRSLGVVNLS